MKAPRADPCFWSQNRDSVSKNLAYWRRSEARTAPVLRIFRKGGQPRNYAPRLRKAKMTGTVKFFSGRRGYGFIAGDDGNDIYVHFSGIDGHGFRMLHAGERVSYEPTDSARGPRAEHVAPLPEEKPSASDKEA